MAEEAGAVAAAATASDGGPFTVVVASTAFGCGACPFALLLLLAVSAAAEEKQEEEEGTGSLLALYWLTM